MALKAQQWDEGWDIPTIDLGYDVDLALDLTDALHVVLSRVFQTNAILTKDHRDFRAIRPLTGQTAFCILPADE